jgi:hypothetical protein
MEDLVIPKYNHMIKRVEDFVTENNGLIRKNYALKAQQELGGFFSLAMNAYLGKSVDYKEFAKKHREEHFGIKVTNEEDIAE